MRDIHAPKGFAGPKPEPVALPAAPTRSQAPALTPKEARAKAMQDEIGKPFARFLPWIIISGIAGGVALPAAVEGLAFLAFAFLLALVAIFWTLCDIRAHLIHRAHSDAARRDGIA